MNNYVSMIGRIATPFTYSHSIMGEVFYAADILSERLSGKEDRIPIMISKHLIDLSKDYEGMTVSITGQFRSHNRAEGEKKRLILYILVNELNVLEEGIKEKQVIELTGFFCGKIGHKNTPTGRRLADILVAVHRNYKKSDYIPCVCWGRKATFVEELSIGTPISIIGRIESRNYKKRIGKENVVKTAYEVAVSKIEVIEEKEI